MRNLLVLSVTAAALAATPVPVLTSPAEAKGKTQICMTRQTKGRRGGDKSFLIVVNKANRSSMVARGFKKTGCKGNGTQRADYQKQMCKFASIAPLPVQADFKKMHGATPTELCEASK